MRLILVFSILFFSGRTIGAEISPAAAAKHPDYKIGEYGLVDAKRNTFASEESVWQFTRDVAIRRKLKVESPQNFRLLPNERPYVRVSAEFSLDDAVLVGGAKVSTKPPVNIIGSNCSLPSFDTTLLDFKGLPGEKVFGSTGNPNKELAALFPKAKLPSVRCDVKLGNITYVLSKQQTAVLLSDANILESQQSVKLSIGNASYNFNSYPDNEILWMGDLNEDGKIDVITYEPYESHSKKRHETLYVSDGIKTTPDTLKLVLAARVVRTPPTIPRIMSEEVQTEAEESVKPPPERYKIGELGEKLAKESVPFLDAKDLATLEEIKKSTRKKTGELVSGLKTAAIGQVASDPIAATKMTEKELEAKIDPLKMQKALAEERLEIQKMNSQLKQLTAKFKR